jgi:integrase
MSIFKRGNVYWYHFLFNGEHIQKSTKQGNPRTARQIEAAHRTALAKGEVGITEAKVAPMFSDLAKRFIAHCETRHENKPQTIRFYAAKLNQLMNHTAIGGARADRIDEGVIECYVVARRASVGPATVNRELATLRRILRLAHEWRDISRVPRIRLLSGERTRDFVLTWKQEELYLTACPQPLHDIAVLMLETGLRIGEALNLEWADVTLVPLHGSRFGYLRVREGKSKSARRIVPLTDRASSMLKERVAEQSGLLVFANREGKRYVSTSINHLHRKAFAPMVDGERRQLFPGDFVLHSLRHTMFTRLGESGVDAFTIMRIAGHSSIVVSQRYIHPSPESMERAMETLQRASARGRDANQGISELEMQQPATVSATVTMALPVSC